MSNGLFLLHCLLELLWCRFQHLLPPLFHVHQNPQDFQKITPILKEIYIIESRISIGNLHLALNWGRTWRICNHTGWIRTNRSQLIIPSESTTPSLHRRLLIAEIVLDFEATKHTRICNLVLYIFLQFPHGFSAAATVTNHIIAAVVVIFIGKLPL